MEQLAYLLAGAALTGAFYFVQRRIERRGTTEAIDRHQKLLALKHEIERENPRATVHAAQQPETFERTWERFEVRRAIDALPLRPFRGGCRPVRAP